MEDDRCSDLTARCRRRPGGGHMVDVAGELDIAGVAILDAALRRPELAQCSRIVLDLDRVRFVDCAGIRLLLAAHTRLRAGGVTLEIIPPANDARRIFALTDTEHLLPFVDRHVHPIPSLQGSAP